MSPRLLSRSPDLRRLVDEGYQVEVRGGHLLVGHVPYVAAGPMVCYGTLVSELTLAGDRTAPPSTHVAQFCGAQPCDSDGRPLTGLIAGPVVDRLADGTEINFSFSAKPTTGVYPDYHAKMTTYAAILAGHAQALEPSATATPFPVIETDGQDSVFRYLDTASSRAGINAATARLECSRVAIVGLGGTGAYILDLLAKTPVREIHLYDGDRFHSHNAFRAPGAPLLEQLRQAPSKVGYLANLYGRMHRGIVAHELYLDDTSVEQLRGADFVFLALDRGATKKLLVERLEQYGVPFIDVGMGVYLVQGADSLSGLLRVTTSTPARRAHVAQGDRIPYGEGEGNNEYDRNIQIADLNMLNAALAVLKWKKLCGFYLDLEREHFAVFQIDGNTLTNEDRA